MRNVSLLLAIVMVVLFFPIESQTADIYRWRDETGKLYIVDDIERVPSRHRNQAREKEEGPGEPAAPLREQKEPAVVSPTAGGTYTVHLASFKERIRADRYVEKLKNEGLKAFRWQVDLPAKGRWHRVCVGSFLTRNQAKLFAANLQKEGRETFVIRLSMQP